MAQYSALRCVSGIWQNNEKPFISNGLRFIVTCLPTAALWVLFHAMRHSLATRLLKDEQPLPMIANVLGHSSSNSTKSYLRVDMDGLKKCLLPIPPVPLTFYEQKGGIFYE